MNKENNNSGFTLVELLAVIVILAIIALIAVPMILGIVEKSRKSAAISSAYGYIDAVEKQMIINTMDSDQTNDISDGAYTIAQLTEKGIKVKGDKPSEGCLTIERSKIVSYSLKIGNYVINPIDGKAEATKNGTVTTCSSSSSSSSNSGSNLATAHISSQQIWDCQRSPAMPKEGSNFTLSGLDTPLDKNWDPWNPQNGHYLKVVFVNSKVRLDEYDENGNKVLEFSNEGDLYLLDKEKHIYFFNGAGTGYAFCTDPDEAQIFSNNNGGSFPYEGIEIVESLD